MVVKNHCQVLSMGLRRSSEKRRKRKERGRDKRRGRRRKRKKSVKEGRNVSCRKESSVERAGS